MVIELKRGAEAKTLENLSEKLSSQKKKNSLKEWAGTIRLSKDPLDIQKEMRNEWD